jgi:dTMP kinase
MTTGRGCFVVLEGGDGSGKSTQVELLVARLREAGHEVVATFEPGATATGAAIRALLLDGTAPVAPEAEALLMAADRAQHVAEVVAPALARGAWVVSDRHLPSSLAYQGVARGLGVDAVEAVNRLAVDGVTPDLVVLLDVADDVATARRAGGAGDRLEREAAAFHATVRAAYRDLAAARGWLVVDGSGARDEVAARVWAAVTENTRP